MRGRSRDYPAYPEITAQLGYNPARFLDVPVRKNGRTKELSANALIRGIDDIETVRAWLTIEDDLGRGRNGGPRQRVVKWLNRRQSQIERDDATLSSSTADVNDGSTSATAEDPPTVDPEPASSDEPPKPTPATGETTPDTATTVATDGGAPSSSSMPRCPDCRGELTPEEVGNETAHWCAHCGGFRDPIGGSV